MPLSRPVDVVHENQVKRDVVDELSLDEISDRSLVSSTEPSRTTWHVERDEPDMSCSLRDAQHLTSMAAQRVWEELYVSKKPAIEEAFKISLGANTQHRAPSLELVRDASSKLWFQYVEAERRSAYRTALEVSTPNQIQSKIQKVTGGLTRLTSRSLTITKSRTLKDEAALNKRSTVTSSIACWADAWLASQYQLCAMKEQIEADRRQKSQALEHLEQFNSSSWKKIEQSELLRVRGIWGPQVSCRRFKEREQSLMKLSLFDRTSRGC